MPSDLFDGAVKEILDGSTNFSFAPAEQMIGSGEITSLYHAFRISDADAELTEPFLSFPVGQVRLA